MPEYVRGVLNLRGKIVPIMNLRVRFGLPRVEDTEETCIIVIQEEKHLMGIVVDKVSEVADLKLSKLMRSQASGNRKQRILIRNR